MKRTGIKRSFSRKPLESLSTSQRRRVIEEVRSNLPFPNRSNCLHSYTDYTNSIASTSTINITPADDSFSHSPHDTHEDVTFTACSSVSTAENDTLSYVESPSFQDYARTFIKTPRDRVNVFSVEPGEYIHFDLEAKISAYLKTVTLANCPNVLEIDISTDGCNLDRNGIIHLWPIQIRVANINNSKPIIVGVYKGNKKPQDSVRFFQYIICDIIRINTNEGINFNGNKMPIRLRAFIADAPARAFILNHRGHTSHKPCSKCKVVGTRVKDKYVFRKTNNRLRTNDEYSSRTDRDHHKEGITPLSQVSIGLVSNVPFEYMHLVCLGVMKKLLSAWVTGKFSRLSKFSSRCISIISHRLKILVQYCPSEFARRPKPIDAFNKFKATEFRQFLLYTGPVVLYGLINESIYNHFLLFHATIRVLVSPSTSSLLIHFAELAIRKFVERCEELYGLNFYSYNVHGLLHICQDVRTLGNLDSFSAFPYENNMSIFRKLCRKPHLPLQQLVNRFKEIENNVSRKYVAYPSKPRYIRRSGRNKRPTYSKISFKNFLISIETRNNSCILHDGSICIINNIELHAASSVLLVKKFLQIEIFYDVGLPSTDFYVYKCSKLQEDVVSVKLDSVLSKCFRMPLFLNEDNIYDFSTFLVFSILHCDN
ncbi:uncharacterized protein [Prorops nasuta]|uniref:uncharacterized protein n=1 Tax=Prorops nasuta TaxID=863751 RepID=UPI0034CE29F1